MCGRYTITRQAGLIEDFEAVLDDRVQANVWWKPRFNVAPTQPAPVVMMRDGVRTLEMMRWGLVPLWGTKPGAKPPLMINARVESLGAKQVFRDALAHKRCLVPADGFFEWCKNGRVPRPMYIHPGDGRFVAFAGLWASAGPLHSFTIVTGPGNALVKPIHDRMPMVLERDVWSTWLDPEIIAERASEWLTVPALGDWRVDEVSPKVNKVANDDATLVVAVQGVQPSLF